MKLSQLRKTRFTIVATLLAALAPLNGGFVAFAQPFAVSPTDGWSYADVADLFAQTPFVVRMRIARATALRGQATAPGMTRFYVEGDVITLIRGTQAVPPQLAWIVDVAADSRGRVPKLRKTEVLVAALPVSGRPGEIRLAARDAQVPWSPALETRVRAVIASATAADAPPAITGVASAFHSAGTVLGEGETQIFLSTATRQPVSLTVLTRPGQPKRWAFAIGEIVDEAAAPPARDTFAWYRLACSLPPALPAAAVTELARTDADAARVDYAFVISALGPCTRTRR